MKPDVIDVVVSECPMHLTVGTYGDSNRKFLSLGFIAGIKLVDITVDVVDEQMDDSLYEDQPEEIVNGIHSGDIFAINNIGHNIGLMECLQQQGVIERIDATLSTPVPLGDGCSLSMREFPLARLVTG